jgi:ubiquinone/menaquinone biosynthesis C-methylase UbiE
MDLQFPDNSFDVAVMPLVIFFVPDPAKGVAEMVRVVRPGGLVGAYSWDMVGGGFPYEVLHDEMRSMGVLPATAPSLDASRVEVMTDLWTKAGLEPEKRVIEVHRTYSDFDEYWTTVLGAPSAGAKLAAMSTGDLDTLKARIKDRLPIESSGRITTSARANAIKGWTP